MKAVVTDCQELLGVWLATRTEGEYIPGQMKYIGLWDGEKVVAVSGFGSFNGASITMHCAGDGKTWLNKEFLWFSFYYPFVQLGAKAIISPVESTNLACRRFIEHIGFTLEATLRNCALDGDLLLYQMERENCRWLDLKRNYPSGKTQSTCST